MQRCQAQLSTWAMAAALRPWWASEMASWTRPGPPPDQAAQDLPPERLGLGRAHIQADDLALASLVHT